MMTLLRGRSSSPSSLQQHAQTEQYRQEYQRIEEYVDFFLQAVFQCLHGAVFWLDPRSPERVGTVN